MCKYDGKISWIAERKTVHDLANSIRLRRWSEQSARLSDAGCRVFFIIEGNLRDESLGVPYNALLSAILNAELRKNTHVIRTMDVKETASCVKHLVQKCENPGAVPTGVSPNASLTKRKRDAQPDLVFMRQLMCIPTISENVSRKLRDEFGNLPTLQQALRDKHKFPKISLDPKHTLGKARIDTLSKYLL